MIRIISAWSANTFAALGHRQFRILFYGTLFATLAYMMMMFTMGIVAEELSGTNAAVGMIAFAIGLSMFFLSPFGGVVADRINRKWLIVLGQGAGALLLAVIGLLLVAGLLTMPIFFVLSLFLGSTFVFMSPARQAFTADIVGPRLVANAIVLSQMSHMWGQPFSPFIASILVKTPLGPGGTYIVMATLVFVGVATVALMRYRRVTAPVDASAPLQKRSVRRDMGAGAVYVWRRPQLRFMMLLLVATIVVGSVFRIVLPRYMVEVLDRAPADQGVLLLTYGLGAAAAGLIIAGIATSRWAWPVLLAMIALMGAGHFLLAGASSFGHATIALAIMGPGLQGPMMLLQANIMMNTEPAYYGRVMSFTMMAWGLQMLISLPIGFVADFIGEREVMVMLGVLGGGARAVGDDGLAGDHQACAGAGDCARGNPGPARCGAAPADGAAAVGGESALGGVDVGPEADGLVGVRAGALPATPL